MSKPYYEQDGVTIYHGDYRDALPLIAARSVDLLVTDPPFFLPALIRSSRRDWPRSIGNLGVMGAFFRDAIDHVMPLLKPTSSAYIFSDSTSYGVFLAAVYPLFDRTQCIVWDKGRGGLGHGWRHSHEMILHAAFASSAYCAGFRRDVMQSGVVPSADRLHPSEKPSGLMGALLTAHPSGCVLDPFMGSGATLVAARHLGYPAIGIEIDEGCCEIAANRLRQYQPPLELPA